MKQILNQGALRLLVMQTVGAQDEWLPEPEMEIAGERVLAREYRKMAQAYEAAMRLDRRTGCKRQRVAN